MQIEEPFHFLEEHAKNQKGQFNGDNVINVYKNCMLADNFSSSQLSKLDHYNYLENYLLPNYQQSSFREFDLSIATMINFKFSHGIHFWDYFKENNLTNKFKILLYNLLNIDKADFKYVELIEFTCFLSLCFKYIEEVFISDETQKLYDVSILKLLSKDYLKALFLRYPKFISLYKEIRAKDSPKESFCIPNLILLFWHRLVDVSSSLESAEPASFTFFEKFIELLCDLLSQYSTRKALKFYIEDTKFILKAKLSKLIIHERGNLVN